MGLSLSAAPPLISNSSLLSKRERSLLRAIIGMKVGLRGVQKRKRLEEVIVLNTEWILAKDFLEE